MMRPGVVFTTAVLSVLAVHLAADPHTEPFFNNDETRHVMTGVFVRDALADLPASAAGPKEFALRYYVQHPALGLLTWPPFFYLAEGAAMFVLGTSYPTARLAVGFFAVLAGWFTFRLAARTHGLAAAGVAVLLLGLSPLVYEYTRRVMLEIPTLALVLGAVFHFERYLDEERPRDAVLACVLAALAALTRFDGVVLLPYTALRLLARGRVGLLARRPVVLGLGLALVMTVPYYLFTWHVYGAGLTKTAAEGTRPDDAATRHGDKLTFYPASLPDQVGWPLVVAAAVGLVVCVRSNRPVGPYLALAAATYATFTPMAELEPRHAIYWVPAVAVLAAAGVCCLPASPTVRAAAAAGLVLATGWDAVNRPAWWVTGYDDAARYVTSRASGDRPVMVDGLLNGSFVYHVRRADPERTLAVLRGDKLLYAMFSDPRTAYTELAATEAEVLAVLDRYDPEYVVVEQPRVHFTTRGGDLLRAALRDHPTKFRLEHTVPVRSNHVNRFGGVRLEVYRKLDRNPHPASVVEFPVFGLGGRVRASPAGAWIE